MKKEFNDLVSTWRYFLDCHKSCLKLDAEIKQNWRKRKVATQECQSSDDRNFRQISSNSNDVAAPRRRRRGSNERPLNTV